MKEYILEACHGMKIDVKCGQTISVIDIDGGQVVDFFAERTDNPSEFLSTGVTIDCNESLKIGVNDYIYSNLYNPMFEVIVDDVKEHDLLHPCCRKEMYDFFYSNGENHPNCLDNINFSLASDRPIIHPLNVFMYTKINTDGTISVEKPLSKSGDRFAVKALMNVRLGIAACSVSESNCNSGKCTSVKIIIE